MKPPHSGGRPPSPPRSGPPRSDAPRSDAPRSGPARSGPARSGAPRSGASYKGAPNAGAQAAGSSRATAPHSPPRSGAPKSNPPEPGTPGAFGRLTAPDRTIAAAPPAPAPTPTRAPHTGGPSRPRSAPQTQRAAAPPGTIWLYGIHPVAAALANPNRRLRRLLVTEDTEATLAGMLKPPFSIAPERTDRARLDQMLGHDTVHQGVALLADPLPQPTLTHVLERPGPVLILDQVTDPRNIGAILRSAAAFGVAGVITQDRNAPEETGALAKAASGALETIPVIRAVNLARTLVALKAANLWVVGLAADMPALRGTAFAQRRVALVLGAEGAGMRRLTRETCDELAGLAMPGSMESLNVSAAATVALYELTRSA